MCGIVGVMQYDKRGITKWDYDVFFELLHADALRGMHGTGVLAIDKKGNSQMAKIGGPPHQLVATPEYRSLESFLKNRDARFLIGHNRYATRGKKVTEHAHPFRHGNVVLVHNGTLDKYNHFPLHPTKKIDVDSEDLCYAIDQLGIDKAIKDTLGAWTIVYWNRLDKTLNILRNDQRPLFMATHGKEFFAFASEKEMLQWILERNHFWSVEIEEVPTDSLLTFGLDKPTPIVREVKGQSYPKKSKEELRKGYESLFKDDIIDVSGTSEKVSEVIDITAPTRSFSIVPSAPQSRAPTGKVKYFPPEKKKERDQSKNWATVKHLHDLSQGSVIGVELFNYNSISRPSEFGPKMFLSEFLHDGYPDIEFQAYVTETELNSFLDSKLGVIGVVANILKSNDSTAKIPHRIYLHKLEPVEDTDPKIPEHAYAE